MKRKQSIAIDFDGVMHKYSKGWHDGTCYDEPIEGVFKAIQELMKKYNVFIFSTRNSKQIKKWVQNQIMESDYGINGIGDPYDLIWPKYGYKCQIIPFWIKFWNKENVLGITKRKLPALVYVDDRALKFEGNWEETLKDIFKFKTYQHVKRIQQ